MGMRTHKHDVPFVNNLNRMGLDVLTYGSFVEFDENVRICETVTLTNDNTIHS